MKSTRFFGAVLISGFCAAIIFCAGSVCSAEESSVFNGNGAIIVGTHQGVEQPAQQPAEIQSVNAVSSVGRIVGLSEYEQYGSAESYGSSYWGFMQDN